MGNIPFSQDFTKSGGKFSGEDPILIFDSLTKLFDEADTLDTSDGKIILLLPRIPKGSAGNHYHASTNGSRSGSTGRIVHLSEDVQYVLRIYATEAVIDEAIDELLYVCQGENEDETDFFHPSQ